MTTPRRADATENRARIVRIAREDVKNGGELKLNAVAKRAGVGQGTLYRHFPTREDLLAEVYRDDVDDLVATAGVLLTTCSAFDALTRWFSRVADYARVKQGVLAAVESGVGRDLTTHSIGPIGDAVTTLLDAGKTEGSIRHDVDARDIILLIGYLTRLEDSEWDTRAHHVLDIILDGLRAGAHSPARTDGTSAKSLRTAPTE
ncbi:TetR/AcrR family transcriptional regulator [Rhodococcoides yunnanense]|uniref:TetR/AcrR family transcriptional regulator n=1 Tax=Rhodococcoides yunnanense TaxID=278209 RepID=UPI000934B659|nr:TetR/AcrR family transcriptional regulator [Rhodococcus yunnanensis]